MSIRFRGREMAHTEIGREVMMRFYESLKGISEIESEPKLEGRNMTMMLAPKKEM